jgi:hypothetical protein
MLHPHKEPSNSQALLNKEISVNHLIHPCCYTGGPAERCGLIHIGDVLTAIDNANIDSFTIGMLTYKYFEHPFCSTYLASCLLSGQIRSLILGEEGSTIVCTLVRGGGDKLNSVQYKVGLKNVFLYFRSASNHEHTIHH